jgi:hypothetical protein
MHICFKIIKFLLQSMLLYVSDTAVSIIRSLPPLHMQPLVTVWFCVGCVLQPRSVDQQYQQSRAGGRNQHKITR